MEATGQMIFDYKKKFIQQKKLHSSKKNQPKDVQFQPKPSQQVKALSPPEEQFKIVRDQLKINQSALTPDKDNIQNQKLEDLIGNNETLLLRIETVWPFEFFTNEVSIDPHKVNIIFRDFFWTEQIHSVLIRDILDVVVETSIFFATLKIVDQGYTENSINITYLKKAEALEARQIIQGLVVAHRQGVDFSKLDTKNLKDQVTELGKVLPLEN